METFAKLYVLPNHKVRANTNMDSFVFCGRNWDYYFTRKSRAKEMELLENVALIDRGDGVGTILDRDYDSSTRYLISLPI